MTRKAKTTNPKPVVTMNEHQDVFIDGRRIGWISNITFVSETGLGSTELRAIADFLDQLEGADLLSQVTEDGGST